MNKLNHKLFVLALLIATFAIGMTTLLIAFKINNAQRDLQHARFDLIAYDIDRVIAQSAALGLNFSELTALPAALERRKALDSAVVDIDVAKRDGEIIYSTNPARIGIKAPLTWQAMIRRHEIFATPGSNDWRILGKEESVAGLVVTNSFGVDEGLVAVRYASHEGAQAQMQLIDALLPIAAITFVVVVILLFALMLFLMRRFEHTTSNAAEMLLATDATEISHARSGWARALLPVVDRVAEARGALAAWRQNT